MAAKGLDLFPVRDFPLPIACLISGDTMIRWILVLWAAAVLTVDSKVLVSFPREKTEISRWMEANGWVSKRDDPRRFEVANEVLHLVSAKDSVMIGTERGFPIDCRTTPWLQVRFRIGRIPTGTNLAKKDGDDAAFRVYVAFDKGGGLLRPPNSIAYTWTEDVDPGTFLPSDHFSTLHYCSIGKGTPNGNDWVTVERNLSEDYKKVFKEEAVPNLQGIMVKCDSNDTGTSAEAWLSSIKLVPLPQSPPPK